MRLFLLFIVVPAVELILLIEIGRVIGALTTVGIIVLTGIIGASLARHQGIGALQRAREEMSQGRVPAQSIADGILILVAGALLITPGVLTDIVGFLCLIPGTRQLIKAVLRRRFEKAVREGRVHMNVRFTANMNPGAPGSPGASGASGAPGAPRSERADPKERREERRSDSEPSARDVPFEVDE